MQSTLSGRLMAGLVRLCDSAGAVVVVAAVVWFVVSVLITMRMLGFATDRNDLIGSQAAYHQNYIEFQKEFVSDDDMVLVVTGPDADTNRKVIDRLGDLLRQDSAHFGDVYDKLHLDFVRQRLLLYMSVDDLKSLQKELQNITPFVKRMLDQPGVVPLFVSINNEIQTFIRREVAKAVTGGSPDTPTSAPADAPDIAGSLPILTGIVTNMGASLSGEYRYKSPWSQMFSAGKSSHGMEDLPSDVYVEFDDGRVMLCLVKAQTTSPGVSFVPLEDVIGALRAVRDRVAGEFPAVQIGLTGEPILENDEMKSSTADSAKASLISLVLISILFAVTFSSRTRPALAIACLVLAMGWTMGYCTLVIGHLNIITVTVMPMLIGLGIDFGIQVICRYDEELAKGLDPAAAMNATMGGTGMSIVAAGLTTAVSFLSAALTGFKGIVELGLLAGGGLLFSLLAMVVVLPAMLLLVDKARLRRGGTSLAAPSPLAWMEGVEHVFLEHPWGVLFLGVLFTAVCVMNWGRVWFDGNLLHLQSRGLDSVTWEHKLIEKAGHSVLFAAVVADDLTQAREKQKKLLALKTVQNVESVVELFPENQEEKLRIAPKIQQVLSKLPPLQAPLPVVDTRTLARVIGELRSIFFVIYPEVRAAGELEIASQIRHFVIGSDQLLDRLEHVARNSSQERLFGYQKSFFQDIEDKLALFRGSGPLRPMTLDTLPRVLRNMGVGRHGKFMLRVLPKAEIWDPKNCKPFLDDVLSVDAKATGTPVMMYESTRLLRESYEKAGKIALAVIAVLALLHFLSLLAPALALLPLLLAMAWMLGILGLLGIPFNPANYLVLPLIIGIGVANGIYVVRRYQEEGHASLFGVSTGRAILLSNCTAMIGFGSLMVARYQGIFSLGVVMTLGVGSCMLTSLLILPALLQILHRWEVKV